VPASSLSHPFPAPTCLFQTIEVAIFGRVAGSEARWCSVAGTTGYRHVAPDQRRVPSPLQQTIHQSQTTQDTVRHEGVRSTGQCNTVCSLSAGVWKPKVFRGR
jgi:hypothetical protein